MSISTDSQSNFNLEQQRKRAKDLRRARREGSIDAAVRIIRHLPRAKSFSAEEALKTPITLSEAQLVVAREAGFSSWPALRHHIEMTAGAAARDAEAIAERIVGAALAGQDDAVRTALERNPGVPQRSIHVAATVADVEAALALLEADTALADRRGGARSWTPLLYLCCSRYGRDNGEVAAARVRIAQRLIDLGADVNAAGQELGFTAPCVNQMFDEHEPRAIEGAAGRAANLELVRLLLRAGADLSKTVEVLGQAVRGGNVEVLKLLLQELPPSISWQVGWAGKACAVLNKPDMAKILAAHVAPEILETGLLWAIEFERNAELIEILLGGKNKPALPTDRSVWERAYRQAARYGHRAAAELLRRRSVDDACLTITDRVIAACIDGDLTTLQRLIREPDYSRSMLSGDDKRMLPWAIRTGRNHAVPLLIEAGFDPNVPDRDGETPLHLAVKSRFFDLIDVLLAADASVETRNFDAQTPLEVALAEPNAQARQQLTRRLLDAGANAATHADRETAREDPDLLFERAVDAVVFGDVDVLSKLLDENSWLVHARSPRPHRATLLHYVGANGVEDERQRTPQNAPAIAQLLLERGSDVDSTCKLYGGGSTTMGLLLTSIHPVKAGLRRELTEVLLNFGAFLDGGTATTGLSAAAALGRLDLVKKLSNQTARKQRQSAFMWACQFGRTKVVDFLADQGADLAEQNGAGQTGLHLAALSGYLETVTLLLARNAPLEIENVWGGTVLGNVLWGVLHYDPHADYASIIEALVEAGAHVPSDYPDWWVKQDIAPAAAKERVHAALARGASAADV